MAHSLTGSPVLPPIPTKGLTSAHVDELVKKTREDMLQALKEISVPVDDPRAPAAPEAVGRSRSAIGVTEVQREGRRSGQEGQVDPETGPRQRTISIASASEETEDEGAVLVRRP